MSNRRITLMRPSEIFDNFMDEFFNSPSMINGGGVPIDVYEDENNVYVDLKAPGFKKEDIDINIKGDLLTVAGKIKDEIVKDRGNKKYYTKEVREESFSRIISLPSKVDSDKSSAKIEDGMIRITLTKLPESDMKKISIAS